MGPKRHASCWAELTLDDISAAQATADQVCTPTSARLCWHRATGISHATLHKATVMQLSSVTLRGNIHHVITTAARHRAPLRPRRDAGTSVKPHSCCYSNRQKFRELRFLTAAVLPCSDVETILDDVKISSSTGSLLAGADQPLAILAVQPLAVNPALVITQRASNTSLDDLLHDALRAIIAVGWRGASSKAALFLVCAIPFNTEILLRITTPTRQSPEPECQRVWWWK